MLVYVPTVMYGLRLLKTLTITFGVFIEKHVYTKFWLLSYLAIYAPRMAWGCLLLFYKNYNVYDLFTCYYH